MEKSVKSESLPEKSTNFINNAKKMFDIPQSKPHMASTMYSQPASQNYQPQVNM
jgi:PBP1b-binding outer membrane lipoprotein LpoB